MDGLGTGIASAGLVLAIAWYSIRRLQHAVDPIERLRSLAKLHEDGLLDEAEHRKLRKRQLSRLKWGD